MSTAALLSARRTLGTCIGQPVSAVDGWLGTAAFEGRVVTAISPTFQSGATPAVRMFSSTTVLDSPGRARSLVAVFDAPNFGSCFGQYQAAATPAPATAQVQSVPLSVPEGVKAFGYLTVFHLADGNTETVGRAFIVGGSIATILQPSADGTSIPSADFSSAFAAVSSRVAKADNS